MVYREVFKLFSKKEGSQHIASAFALKGLESIIKKNEINYVFEFGIGIGTIPYLLGTVKKGLIYFGTENNDYCIEQLKSNLKELESDFSFNHLTSYEEMKTDQKFDLIIFDGAFKDSNFLKKIAHQKSIIFVEGDRSDQIKFITAVFPKALVSQSICNLKNSDFAFAPNKEQKRYVGGYTLIRLDNNFENKLKWFSEKLRTYFLYKIRKLKS